MFLTLKDDAAYQEDNTVPSHREQAIASHNFKKCLLYAWNASGEQTVGFEGDFESDYDALPLSADDWDITSKWGEEPFWFSLKTDDTVMFSAVFPNIDWEEMYQDCLPNTYEHSHAQSEPSEARSAHGDDNTVEKLEKQLADLRNAQATTSPSLHLTRLLYYTLRHAAHASRHVIMTLFKDEPASYNYHV